MEKVYFHNVTNKNKRTILMLNTFAIIVEAYDQPEWCGKHEALNGLFGCNKLLGLTNEITTKESCINCKFYKDEVNK